MKSWGFYVGSLILLSESHETPRTPYEISLIPLNGRLDPRWLVYPHETRALTQALEDGDLTAAVNKFTEAMMLGGVTWLWSSDIIGDL